MSSQTDTFKIRWGKLALALIGVLAVIATPVTFIAALVSPMSLVTPLLFLMLVVLSFAGLRASAVQDRRAKAWQRAAATVPQREATQPQAADAHTGTVASVADAARPAEGVAPARAQGAADAQAAKGQSAKQESATAARKDSPFDLMAQDEAPAEEAASPRDVTAPARPAAQVPDASSGAVVAAAAPMQTPKPETSWSPREIPTPGYVAAARAERAAPAPLEPAEEKRAKEVTSIRQAEADRVSQERAERLNLDAVLQRRRA